MNTLWISAIAIAAAQQASTETEIASGEEESKPAVEIVERDQSGKATLVRIEGQTYPLCSETVSDGCINPRSAGFDWGTQPLDHWPGQTATSLKEGAEKVEIDGEGADVSDQVVVEEPQ